MKVIQQIDTQHIKKSLAQTFWLLMLFMCVTALYIVAYRPDLIVGGFTR